MAIASIVFLLFRTLLVAAILLGVTGPLQATPIGFGMTSQSYWTSTNTDKPGGWGFSDAGESGSRYDYLSGASYWLQAVSSAWGINRGSLAAGRGAGGHHQEFWDVTLQLVGEDGEAADLYINGEVWGEVDVLVFALARAFVTNRSSLLITNSANTVLLDYSYTWSEDKNFVAAIIGKEYETSIDSLYLGTMTVGDPEWGSIRIQGYQFATATAQADFFGASESDIVSRFQFDIKALEVPSLPEPVPEPSTMLLVGTGLIGLLGFRRKFRK